MSLPHDDLVALAASLTALTAIPAAVLVFFVDRGLKQQAAVPGIRVGTALAILVVAAYTLAIDLGAWWAWTEATDPRVVLAAGITHRTGYAVAFGPMAFFAVASGAWAFWRLTVRACRAVFSSPA